MQPIPFGKPVFTQEELDEVARILQSGWVGTGPKAQEFEADFGKYIGVKHALGVASGTAALHVALRAAGVGEGDEVITTAMTFAASVNAIIMTGATPVLVDCDQKHFNIDLNLAEKAITKRTKAILPVHFAGAPVDVDGLNTLRSKHGVKVVHDCAHAIETEWNGKKVGSAGDVSCFSFYATKNITTVEGGMICTDSDEIADPARLMRNHGMSKDAWKRFRDAKYHHYDIECMGYKSNLTDLQAGLGILQLKKIEERLKIRQKIWGKYQSGLKNTNILLPLNAEKPHRHACHLFTIQTPEGLRDSWLSLLQEHKIGTGVHYRAIPAFSFYAKEFGWKATDYPNAKKFGERTLSLPLSPYLEDKEVDYVIDNVKKISSEKA